MNIKNIRKLVKFANKLDLEGKYSEADSIDKKILKLSTRRKKSKDPDPNQLMLPFGEEESSDESDHEIPSDAFPDDLTEIYPEETEPPYPEDDPYAGFDEDEIFPKSMFPERGQEESEEDKSSELSLGDLDLELSESDYDVPANLLGEEEPDLPKEEETVYDVPQRLLRVPNIRGDFDDPEDEYSEDEYSEDEDSEDDTEFDLSEFDDSDSTEDYSEFSDEDSEGSESTSVFNRIDFEDYLKRSRKAFGEKELDEEESEFDLDSLEGFSVEDDEDTSYELRDEPPPEDFPEIDSRIFEEDESQLKSLYEKFLNKNKE